MLMLFDIDLWEVNPRVYISLDDREHRYGDCLVVAILILSFHHSHNVAVRQSLDNRQVQRLFDIVGGSCFDHDTSMLFMLKAMAGGRSMVNPCLEEFVCGKLSSNNTRDNHGEEEVAMIANPSEVSSSLITTTSIH